MIKKDLSEKILKNYNDVIADIAKNKTMYDGPPKSWKSISENFQKDQLSVINPKRNIGNGYRQNCVNYVIAYDLRQRGYDVIAKSKYECNVSRKANKLWNNVMELRAHSIDEILNTIDISINARYFLGVKYEDNNGHAMVLSVFERNVTILDPQNGSQINIANLRKTNLINQFSYWRIDNLEVSQTGFNACKGRC